MEDYQEDRQHVMEQEWFHSWQTENEEFYRNELHNEDEDNDDE